MCSNFSDNIKINQLTDYINKRYILKLLPEQNKSNFKLKIMKFRKLLKNWYLSVTSTC